VWRRSSRGPPRRMVIPGRMELIANSGPMTANSASSWREGTPWGVRLGGMLYVDDRP
jgi:hypothetical protein